MAKPAARKSKRLSTKQQLATSPPPPIRPSPSKTVSAKTAPARPGLVRLASAALASVETAPVSTPTSLVPTTQPQVPEDHQALPLPTPHRADTPFTPHPLFVIADTPPYERTFAIDRTLYTSHSRLLRRATTEAPSLDLAIALPTIRAFDFEAYVAHYSPFPQELATLADLQWEQIKPKKCILTPAQQTHVRVATLLGYWMMGHSLQDMEFKNVVMDALLREDLAGAGGAAIVQSAGCILSNGQTGAESGLYRLLLDVMAPMVTEEFVDEHAKTWPREFVVDLLKRVVMWRGGQDVEMLPTPADRRRYYEVESEVVERLVGAIG